MEKYKKSKFIKKWQKEMTVTLKNIHPEWNEKDIEDELLNIVQNECKNPIVNLDNNYTHENKDTTLLSVLDWLLENENYANIGGNGTIYKNQLNSINPIANMLNSMMESRKNIKAKMFSLEYENSEIYKDYDRGQLNEKINVNSYYGGSGMNKSAFYSMYSGPATTLTAQSAISTAKVTFEAFYGDNFKFIDVNECFYWLNLVVNEKEKVDKFIKLVSVDEVFERLKSQFVEWDDKYEKSIMRYLSNLSDETLSRIYYKNQLNKFIESHDKVVKLYENIFKKIPVMKIIKHEDEIPKKFKSEYLSVKKYNSYVGEQIFLNPNVIPPSIKEDIEEFCRLCMKYVYVKYVPFDKIYRLKNFIRNRVVHVDTDSNMINCDPWVEFTYKLLLNYNSYKRETEYNDYIAVNTLAYLLSNVVSDILEEYGRQTNIPKEYRGRFKMKNEFLFSKLIMSKVKKRYLSLIRLREGNLFLEDKIDIKGFDFMKAQTSEHAETVFNNIIFDRILKPDTIDTKGLIKDLKKFENEIVESLRSCKTTYLQNAPAKDPKAYLKKSSNPYSNQIVRGVYAWNHIYPDNIIEVPTRVNVLKLNIYDIKSIEGMKSTYPDIYEKIVKHIFENSISLIANKGLQVLAIPTNQDIPEWTLDYIDYQTISNNILGQFHSILELVNSKTIPVGKTVNGVARKTSKLTNLIRF